MCSACKEGRIPVIYDDACIYSVEPILGTVLDAIDNAIIRSDAAGDRLQYQKMYREQVARKAELSPIEVFTIYGSTPRLDAVMLNLVMRYRPSRG